MQNMEKPFALAENHEAIAGAMHEMEALALEMIGCDEEQLEALMARRQEICGRVEALRAACGDTQPASQEEAARVRAAAEEARAAACRVRELDRQVLGRMRRARARILEQIRSVGKSAGARAARYYKPTSQSSFFNGSV